MTDWHLAAIVAAITGVGVLMAILGWSIPLLRSTPALQDDGERSGFGRNVRSGEVCLKVGLHDASPFFFLITGTGDKSPIYGLAMLCESHL